MMLILDESKFLCGRKDFRALCKSCITISVSVMHVNYKDPMSYYLSLFSITPLVLLFPLLHLHYSNPYTLGD